MISCNTCGVEISPPKSKFCTARCKSNWYNAKRYESHTKISGVQQGTLSEIRVAADLLTRGYMVFANCSHFGSIDLISIFPGPNQSPLRIEVKTVYQFDPTPKSTYQLGIHFDHFALIKHNGEIRYKPDLPEGDLNEIM